MAPIVFTSSLQQKYLSKSRMFVNTMRMAKNVSAVFVCRQKYF